MVGSSTDGIAIPQIPKGVSEDTKTEAPHATTSHGAEKKASDECNDEKCEELDSDDDDIEIIDEMVDGAKFRAKQGKYSSGRQCVIKTNLEGATRRINSARGS